MEQEIAFFRNKGSGCGTSHEIASERPARYVAASAVAAARCAGLHQSSTSSGMRYPAEVISNHDPV